MWGRALLSCPCLCSLRALCECSLAGLTTPQPIEVGAPPARPEEEEEEEVGRPRGSDVDRHAKGVRVRARWARRTMRRRPKTMREA